MADLPWWMQKSPSDNVPTNTRPPAPSYPRPDSPKDDPELQAALEASFRESAARRRAPVSTSRTVTGCICFSAGVCDACLAAHVRPPASDGSRFNPGTRTSYSASAPNDDDADLQAAIAASQQAADPPARCTCFRHGVCDACCAQAATHTSGSTLHRTSASNSYAAAMPTHSMPPPVVPTPAMPQPRDGWSADSAAPMCSHVHETLHQRYRGFAPVHSATVMPSGRCVECDATADIHVADVPFQGSPQVHVHVHMPWHDADAAYAAPHPSAPPVTAPSATAVPPTRPFVSSATSSSYASQSRPTLPRDTPPASTRSSFVDVDPVEEQRRALERYSQGRRH